LQREVRRDFKKGNLKTTFTSVYLENQSKQTGLDKDMGKFTPGFS
jgi:hypothetical protein